MSTRASNTPSIELPLRKASSTAEKLLIGMCVGLPLMATAVVVALRLSSGGALPPEWLQPFGATQIAVIAILLGTIPLAWFLRHAMRRQRACIENGMLVLHSSFYRQRIALGELDLAAARVLSLDEHREWRPLLKTNGFALSGFHSGHFRLRNFKKAFCVLAGDGRVVLIPRRNHSVLLLAFRQPEQALEQLRQAAP